MQQKTSGYDNRTLKVQGEKRNTITKLKSKLQARKTNKKEPNVSFQSYVRA